MSGGVYQSVFESRGLRIVTPDAEDRAYVNERYFAELTEGVFTERTLHGISRVVDRMVRNDRIDAVVLGGIAAAVQDTGLPLLPTLETISIHVDSVVTRMLGGDLCVRLSRPQAHPQ